MPDPATGSAAPAPDDRALERALGSQVRALRRGHDLSVADLAAAAHISGGMLSKIENGQISASLGTLQAIAAVLSVPISQLFARFEEREDVSFVAAGQGLTIDRRGTKVGHAYQLLGAALRGEIVIEPYLITLSEDAEPHTGFQHGGQEFLFMLTDAMTYAHGPRRYPMRPGDALLFDPGTPHGPAELTQRPVQFLSIIVYPHS